MNYRTSSSLDWLSGISIKINFQPNIPAIFSTAEVSSPRSFLKLIILSRLALVVPNIQLSVANGLAS
jgi:hypothetical protein